MENLEGSDNGNSIPNSVSPIDISSCFRRRSADAPEQLSGGEVHSLLIAAD